MVLVIHIGKRTPRSWFRKGVSSVQNILSFQTHLWSMIEQAFYLMKKKANSSNTGVKVVIIKEREIENLNYEIEWMKITIQGNKEQELEEYNQAQNLYKQFSSVFKKEMPTDERLKVVFKSKFLNSEKIMDAYKNNYGSVADNNIANKLLEMGILTHIELIADYDSRDIL
jgi:hypothetical protein